MGGGNGQETALHAIMFQELKEPAGDSVFTVHAQSEAGECYAQLRHDDETRLPADVGQNSHHPGCSGGALVGQLCHARPGGGHHGKLHGDKQAIEEYKCGDDHDSKERFHRLNSRSLVGHRRRATVRHSAADSRPRRGAIRR